MTEKRNFRVHLYREYKDPAFGSWEGRKINFVPAHQPRIGVAEQMKGKLSLCPTLARSREIRSGLLTTTQSRGF